MDSQSNSTPVPTVQIGGIKISIDDNGRHSLNDIHRASGLGAEKAPAKWLRNKETRDLVRELENETGQICLVSNEGRNGGTFAHELLAVSFAGWISPPFQLRVNQAFLDARSGKGALPDFSNPAIAARAWADQVEARQLAERTKAQIGSRREATAMASASASARKVKALKIELDRSHEYATVKRMEKHHGRKFPWRPLKKYSLEAGIEIKDVPDANYDKVNSYHADVWRAVYQVEIPAADGGE